MARDLDARAHARRTARVGLIALLIAAAVLWVRSDGGATSGDRPDAPHAPTEIRLPLDAYLPSTPEMRMIGQANGMLVRRCMARFGFDLPVPAGAGTAAESINSRRYSVIDAASVAVHGYHPPSERRVSARTTQPPLSAMAQAVYAGEGRRVVGGQRVPDQGCAGEGWRTLARDVPAPADPYLAQRLSSDSYDRSLRDSRVRRAFVRWSACMAERGHRYRDPLAPLDDPRLGHGTPTRVEIAVATADVACKAQVDLVAVWSAVEAGYQRRQIAEHRDALEQIRSADQALLTNATDILGAESTVTASEPVAAVGAQRVDQRATPKRP